MSDEQQIHLQRQCALDWLTAASPVLLMAFCFYRWTAPLSALMAVAGGLAVSALLQWAGLSRMIAAPALAGGVWLALLLPAGAPLWLGAAAVQLFLCGGLVPREMLPRIILQVGDLLPLGAARSLIAPLFGGSKSDVAVWAAAVWIAVSIGAMLLRLKALRRKGGGE